MEWIQSRHGMNSSKVAARERDREGKRERGTERERERECVCVRERETECACVPLKSSPACCTGLGIFFLSMEYPV